MTPLSPALVLLLDEIREALATSPNLPDRLVDNLQSRWRTERSDDEAELEILLKTLRMHADVTTLKNAQARYGESQLQARDDLDDYDAAQASGQGGPLIDKVGATKRSGWVYPVYFATDRQQEPGSSDHAVFTANRSTRLTCGVATVWIPATHRFGEIGRSFLSRWNTFEFADDKLVVQSARALQIVDFWKAVQAAVSDSTERQGLLYIHGFNSSFNDSVIRAAQVGFDLKVDGATAVFSWPSQGTWRGYPADGAAIEGSEYSITQFLVDFVEKSGARVVHIVAHSMGNRGLLRALQRIGSNAELRAKIKFGQIFLAAPDLDRALFTGLANLYPTFSERTTLYSSDSDKAVAMSAWLHGWDRVGYFNSEVPVMKLAGLARFDSVAVPNFDLDLLGHSYFANAGALLYDMHELIRANTPPESRPRVRQCDGHWEIYR